MPEIVGREVRETELGEIVTQVPVPDPGHSIRVSFSNTIVAVFNSGGRLFALEAMCGHRNGPLDQGPVSDGTVTCPWHGAKFDLDSGKVVGGNIFVRRSTRPVRAFRVRAIGGLIALRAGYDTPNPGSTPNAPRPVAALPDPS
jgi:nitrite reductase/ring-hydroxylating ferredoxin subunit